VEWLTQIGRKILHKTTKAMKNLNFSAIHPAVIIVRFLARSRKETRNKYEHIINTGMLYPLK